METTALYGVESDGIYWVRVNVSEGLEKLILTSSKPLHTLMRFWITCSRAVELCQLMHRISADEGL